LQQKLIHILYFSFIYSGINWVDEHDESALNTANNNNINKRNDGTGKEGFQQQSTDAFKQSHGSVGVSPTYQRIGGNGWGSTFRHPFQTSSTDDFKKPHGMPDNMQAQSAPPRNQQGGRQSKAAFQTSSTADFKQSKDSGTSFDAPQQAQYQKTTTRANSEPYQNRVGKDTYESTQRPKNVIFDAEIIPDGVSSKSSATEEELKALLGSSYKPPEQRRQMNNNVAAAPVNAVVDAPVNNAHPTQDPLAPDWFGSNNRQTSAQPVQPTRSYQPPVGGSNGSPPIGGTATPPIQQQQQSQQVPFTTPPPREPMGGTAYVQQQDLEQWDKKLDVAVQTSGNTFIRPPKFPLVRDPPGVSAEYPILATRVLVTVLATTATRYLHLFNGYSPILASSAMTLFASICLDRRLGQAAFCGSFAGMCGGHLLPNLSMTMALGGITSACYELLIRINNKCLGIGGRLGATAFLATSILAKYQNVGGVGRKLRRGLWGKAGPSTIVVSMILFHMLGSISTILLREYSDDSSPVADPVRASSTVGLVGSLFIKDPMSILALYGGSFVGMSLPSRLMNGNMPGGNVQPQTALSLFTSFAGAGAIAGLIHAITIHYGYWNGGWGGKAGLCAFAGCWVYRGLASSIQYASKRA